MSVILNPRSFACAGIGLSSRPRSPRNLVAAVTAGAVLLALVLAATIPARADSVGSVVARSTIGYLDR